MRLFIIDCAGACRALRRLPHTVVYTTLAKPEVLRRVFAEATGLIDEREDSEKPSSQDCVMVFIDGWDRLSLAHPELVPALHDIAARGLATDVHLVVSSSRWSEVRLAAREKFGTRIELRLGDPFDSEIDRRVADQVPRGAPGRGLIQGPLHVLTALPHLKVDPEVPGSEKALDATVTAVTAIERAWSGPTPPTMTSAPGGRS